MSPIRPFKISLPQMRLPPLRLPRIALPTWHLPVLHLPAGLPPVNLAPLYRVPPWATDAMAGLLLALFAITVAQAALPSADQDPRAEALRRSLRPAQAAAAAPAFVFGQPVQGYPIISPFGLRQLPWEEFGRLHAGVDIAAPAGTPVLAAADGVVSRAGEGGAYGRFVEVRHAGGLTSFYAHLGGVWTGIKAGSAVKLGDPIGLIGSTGSSTGSHLHFEVRDAGHRPLNPEFFLGRQFAAVGDLPLKDAARLPVGMRIAYVSSIPESKRELMEQRELARLEAEAAQAEVGMLELEPQQGERVRMLVPGRPGAMTLTKGPAVSLQVATAAQAAVETAAIQPLAPAVAAPAPPPPAPALRPRVLDDPDAPITTARS